MAPRWLRPRLTLLELNPVFVDFLRKQAMPGRVSAGNVYRLVNLQQSGEVPRDLAGIISYTAASSFFHLDRFVDQAFQVLPPGGIVANFHDCIPYDPALLADLEAKGLFPWRAGELTGAFRSETERETMQSLFDEHGGILFKNGAAKATVIFKHAQALQALFGFYYEHSLDLRKCFASRLTDRLNAAGFQVLLNKQIEGRFIGKPLPVHLPYFEKGGSNTQQCTFVINIQGTGEIQSLLLEGVPSTRRLVRSNHVAEIARLNTIIARKSD